LLSPYKKKTPDLVIYVQNWKAQSVLVNLMIGLPWPSWFRGLVVYSCALLYRMDADLSMVVGLLDAASNQRANPFWIVGFRLGMDIHKREISPLNRDLRMSPIQPIGFT
jgi:hypothetical protein